MKKKEKEQEKEKETEKEQEKEDKEEEEEEEKEERRTRVYDEATCLINPGICTVSSEFGFFPKKTETAS